MRISDDDMDNGLDLIVIFCIFILFYFLFIFTLFDIKGYWYSGPMFM